MIPKGLAALARVAIKNDPVKASVNIVKNITNSSAQLQTNNTDNPVEQTSSKPPFFAPSSPFKMSFGAPGWVASASSSPLQQACINIDMLTGDDIGTAEASGISSIKAAYDKLDEKIKEKEGNIHAIKHFYEVHAAQRTEIYEHRKTLEMHYNLQPDSLKLTPGDTKESLDLRAKMMASEQNVSS